MLLYVPQIDVKNIHINMQETQVKKTHDKCLEFYNFFINSHGF
jgi:hypothetical protein